MANISYHGFMSAQPREDLTKIYLTFSYAQVNVYLWSYDIMKSRTSFAYKMIFMIVYCSINVKNKQKPLFTD